MKVRNVNHALPLAAMLFRDPSQYREVSPRGITTRELIEPMVTIYTNPLERVLFCPARDANPFFHLFESLWILAGREDVKWLSWFLPRIKDFSDNGHTFHGAYGARMNRWGQLNNAIAELKRDPDSRRAVVALWHPDHDSGYTGKDMPCNTTVYFKIREGRLNMTVCNRSNDMVWGAYGANVVQFSTLQEYVAAFLGVPVGVYIQFSDSFHVYTEQEAYKKIANMDIVPVDPYSDEANPVQPYPLVSNPETFDQELSWFMSLITPRMQPIPIHEGDWDNPYFPEVAIPMYNALAHHRADNYAATVDALTQCRASDWRRAAREWIDRRHA